MTLVVAACCAQSVSAQKYESVPILKGDPNATGNPTITEVQSTPLGYVIVGLGFGQDPASVKVLEDGVPVDDSAIAGVSTQRISVLSVPSRQTAISVEIAGAQSTAFDFSYIKPAQAPVPEMPVDDEELSSELNTEMKTTPQPEPQAESAPKAESTSEPEDVVASQPDSAAEPDNTETTTAAATPAKTDAEPVAAPSAASPDNGDLGREVMVLRKRLESMEQEIYELRKAIGERASQ